MMGRYSAVEVIACMFRTGINWGRPIAPDRLIPPPYPYSDVGIKTIHNYQSLLVRCLSGLNVHFCKKSPKVA